MKVKSILLFIWGFLTAGSVFAQEQDAGFVNLYDEGNGNAYISRTADSCGTAAKPPVGYSFFPFGSVPVLTGTCTGAHLIDSSHAAAVLDSLLNADWKPVLNDTLNKTTGKITFLTDFNFAQYKVDGTDTTCLVNHTPLTFKAEYGEIDGNHHLIENVCYFKDIDYSVESLSDTVGLFKRLDSVNVHYLKLKNFHFRVMASKTQSVPTKDASFFGPVGAMAGVMINSLIYQDTLIDVTVSAPMAGGFVGYAKNSTIQWVYSDDDLKVYNQVDLNGANYYAASRTSGWGGEYHAFIGGLVGYAVDLEVYDINVIARVENLSEDTSTVVGGLVGMYALSKKADTQENRLAMKIDKVVMPQKTEKTYTKISGGKSMGGLVGEAAIYKNEVNEAMDLSITNVDFNGSISKSKGSDVHAGGLVGRSAVDGGSIVKIENALVQLTMKDSLSNAGFYEYSVGGLIGEETCVYTRNTVTAESFVSIRNSRTSGSLTVAKKADAENVSANVFMGGLAGRACLARNADALSGNSSSMEMKVAVKGLRGHSVGGSEIASIDSLMVGGFVGKAVTRPNTSGSYTNGDSVLTVRNGLFTGTIEVTDSLNLVRMGGIIGSFADNAGMLYVAFDNIRVNNIGVMTLNPKAGAAFPVQGSAAVGGICGYCIMPNKVDHVWVRGAIKVQGDFSQADSLFVGGVFGGLLSSKDFVMQNAYYIGSMSVPGSTPSDNIYGGYLAGKLTLNGTKVLRKIVSTYHNGDDDLDAFGLFEGGNARYLPSAQGDDWSLIENECSGKSKLNGNMTCWDVRYNVRNGDAENTNENFNGVKTVASMKTPEFADFLNAPFAVEGKAYWGYKAAENGGFPYLLEVPAVVILPSSSSEAVSSSSEPQSSSSSQLPPPPESSCSLSPPSESSSSFWWPIPASSSSLLPPPPESSSSLFVPSSSSELVPVVFSSSEQPLPESSSSFVLPMSSSEPVIVVIPTPEIESHRIEWAGSMARLKFNASVDSLAGKVSVSVRVWAGGSVVVDTLLLDSVPGSVRGASVTFAVSSGDSVAYEIVLQGDSVSAFANGGAKEVQPVRSSRWQMVSLADVDLRKLHLDKYHVLYRWDESLSVGDYLQYRAYSRSDEVAATDGYWYGSYDGVPLKRKAGKYVEGAEIVWNVDSIHSGWNMVANPYSWVVDLSAIKDSGVDVWSWNDESGEYDIPTELKPYEAIWLNASGPQTIKFPAKPKFVKGETKALAKASSLKRSSDGWTVRAILSDKNGKKDSWNMFGTSSKVSTSSEPPSGMGDHVSLAIVESGRALARSFRPAEEEMEWTLSLSASSERTAYLQLDGIDDVNATGKKVFVTVDGKTVEMKDGKKISVKVGSLKKTAVVRVAPHAKSEVEYALKDVRTFRNGSSLDVQFVVSNGLAGSNAKVELVDLSGKVVASLSRTSLAGLNNVRFPALESGLYVLRIRSGSQIAVKKVVLR
ncbi:MAG: T9SS type A sorting domain-containing protein [Fibrobacter sp.]|nr:T9SS type A sorting domain-containing protein [Fibrobacter sp.]